MIKRNLEKVKKAVVKKALNGENVTLLARTYRVSRTFIYKWKKRYEADPTGAWWKERSRAPHHPQRKVTPEVQQLILDGRTRWGLNISKLTVYLMREGYTISHTTIQKVLQAAGEPNWSTRKNTYARYKSFERETPNDLIQVDIKGPVWIEEQGQHLYLVTILDDYSRFLLRATFYTRPVRHDDILRELAICFETYGKPRQVLSDNGAQFFAMRGGTSTFTRTMHHEGVDHIRSRVNHPQTCGKVERAHGTIFRELPRLGLTYCNADLTQYCEYYNYFRPHQGIGMQTPGERFKKTPPKKVMLKSVIDLS